jgi:hypothetical protein
VPDDLRPEVVAALSEPAHLPAAVVDQVLDATDAEREAATADLAKRDELRAKGHTMPGADAALAALDRMPGVVQSVLTGNVKPNGS